ncbi:MAG: hypothetical protein R6U16_02655 [Desulfotignum sp.]
MGKDSEQMIARPKDIYDGAIPSGNVVAVMNLMRLARMTGHTALEQQAQKAMKKGLSCPTQKNCLYFNCGFSYKSQTNQTTGTRAKFS